jgi:hypothetical protein
VLCFVLQASPAYRKFHFDVTYRLEVFPFFCNIIIHEKIVTELKEEVCRCSPCIQVSFSSHATHAFSVSMRRSGLCDAQAPGKRPVSAGALHGFVC